MSIGQRSSTSEVRDYYDTYWSAETPPRYELDDLLAGLLAEHVHIDARCLDLGCGAAQTYAQVINRQASYVGVDVSPKAVELARATGLQAETIDDAGALPFEAESFDLVICIEVLEHLFAPERALSEARRVMRPGGALIVSTPNAAYWRLRTNLLLGRWNPLGDALSIDQPWRDPHIRFFTVAVMRRLLEHVGFSSIEVGAHGGRFLDHLSSRPSDYGVSGLYRRAEQRFPSLLGLTIHAVAVK